MTGTRFLRCITEPGSSDSPEKNQAFWIHFQNAWFVVL